MRVITGTARGTNLKTPDGMLTRPTADRVKEALFNVIQYEIRGEVLDLFAGTGQLGIEALSRGAREAVFVDARRDACQVVRENLSKTRLAERAQVVQMDYLAYLDRCTKRFDLIFLDPPYAEKSLEIAIKRISEIDILADGGIIITERPRGKELQADFPGLTRSRDYDYGKTTITLLRKERREDIL